MKEWFSPAEIVAAKSPELPGTERGLNMIAEKQGWRGADKARRRLGRGRANWEYHISLLPPAAQARLALLYRTDPDPEPDAEQTDASKALWARYEVLSKAQKDECQRRLDALALVERYETAGHSVTASVALAAAEVGASRATLFNWRKMVAGIARCDWRAALAPGDKATATHADCHPLVWEAITSDWLRPEKPSFSSCYRRIVELASANGWLPIPSERALRRRVEFEVPKGVILLAREGREKAKRLYPAQKRTRSHFHAMQAVNADGHKLDVFVRLEDGTITRVLLVALQDLYSGMIVAWRLAESENKEAVRLTIGDMVNRHGIPQKCWLDNGRAFASKWITGRMQTRYRFKIRDEDPAGILTSLGVDVHWTTPYHGQAKPIERAFRDLADNIAKHPFCAGAYTGNRPDAKPENYGNAAIPIAEFRNHVANQIAEHNERPGRKSEACHGRSFLETFKASLAEPSTLIQWPSEAQKALWLLAAEALRTQRGSGEVHFHGNRYWSPELNEYAGQKVVVRFDPDKLHDDIKVYTLDDRLICHAACIAPTGYDDVDAARTHLRDKNAHNKAVAEQLRLIRKMKAAELAQLYGTGEKPADLQPMPPLVKRLATGGAAPVPVAIETTEEEFESSFSRGLRLIEGGADE